MTQDPEHMHDKLGLFALCGALVVVLGAVVAGVFLAGPIPSAGVGLLGTIVGGTISSFNNIVKLIQTSWESAGWGKMTDALAASGPAVDTTPPPHDAVEAANQVAGAANDAADAITSKSTDELVLKPEDAIQEPKP